MLYTLFSPSEGKKSGGSTAPLGAPLFGLDARNEILNAYNALCASSDSAELSKLFGIKNTEEFARYHGDLFSAPTLPALERYDGVAFDYLDFASLAADAKAYLTAHCIIFSNLFGPILGGDRIPDYKVKQGESIGGIAPDRYYSSCFSQELDTLLREHEILDLRAGYYDKFYKSSQPYMTLKFIKEGKVVSHWAKAYRGIVLREIAKAQIESIEEFMKLEIEGLKAEAIKKSKNKTEIVYAIIH